MKHYFMYEIESNIMFRFLNLYFSLDLYNVKFLFHIIGQLVDRLNTF